ncbi:hypothetical protein [Polyangium spumosum]|uniref:Uncharacterized protein n=1 Tax=Polyangium spumosum TaxID=889282 RepID=A0A6N7PZ58_9BACT|nr:hypothetical protein [Polyangium spumosum]MRG96156.1 hypothetical protein [Polyangium spumosum]
MPRLPSLPLLLLLASCAAAPLPAEPPLLVNPPPPVAAAPPADPAPPPAPPPPPETPLPPLVALDAPIACTFDAPRWRGATDIAELALRLGGKPFVRITGGAARLSVPVGPAGDTVLQIQDAGFTVQGHLPASASSLGPNEPFVLNGFAIPTIFARLAWSEGKDASLAVTHAGSDDLEVLDPPLRATRPCADVGLDGRSFVADEAVPGGGESKKQDVKAFLPGSRVAIAVEPKGKPVARIAVKEATHVTVFESRGGMSRVSLPVGTLVVFGWVKTSDLKPAGSLSGYGTGSGRRGLRPPEVVVKERLRCEHDVPLVAEVEGERRTVGAIGKTTPIEVLERVGDEARVRVWTKAIHAAAGALFLVRAFDLHGCAAVQG